MKFYLLPKKGQLTEWFDKILNSQANRATWTNACPTDGSSQKKLIITHSSSTIDKQAQNFIYIQASHWPLHYRLQTHKNFSHVDGKWKTTLNAATCAQQVSQTALLQVLQTISCSSDVWAQWIQHQTTIQAGISTTTRCQTNFVTDHFATWVKSCIYQNSEGVRQLHKYIKMTWQSFVSATLIDKKKCTNEQDSLLQFVTSMLTGNNNLLTLRCSKALDECSSFALKQFWHLTLLNIFASNFLQPLLFSILKTLK